MTRLMVSSSGIFGAARSLEAGTTSSRGSDSWRAPNAHAQQQEERPGRSRCVIAWWRVACVRRQSLQRVEFAAKVIHASQSCARIHSRVSRRKTRGLAHAMMAEMSMSHFKASSGACENSELTKVLHTQKASVWATGLGARGCCRCLAIREHREKDRNFLVLAQFSAKKKRLIRICGEIRRERAGRRPGF